MPDQQGEQFAGGEQGGGEQDYGPGYVVPGSAEYEMAAEFMGVIEEHPELGSDPAVAQAAVATASHLANVFDRPEMATDPGVIEMAHILNSSAPQEPPAPPDPVDVILGGGKGKAGSGVLNGI